MTYDEAKAEVFAALVPVAGKFCRMHGYASVYEMHVDDRYVRVYLDPSHVIPVIKSTFSEWWGLLNERYVRYW